MESYWRYRDLHSLWTIPIQKKFGWNEQGSYRRHEWVESCWFSMSIFASVGNKFLACSVPFEMLCSLRLQNNLLLFPALTVKQSIRCVGCWSLCSWTTVPGEECTLTSETNAKWIVFLSSWILWGYLLAVFWGENVHIALAVPIFPVMFCK